MYSVVFLVIQSDTLFMFSNTIIRQSLQKVNSFIDNDFCDFSSIVFQIEVVLGQLLDGEVSGANGTFFGKNVGSFSNTSGKDVVDVGFVSFHLFFEKRYIINRKSFI